MRRRSLPLLTACSLCSLLVGVACRPSPITAPTSPPSSTPALATPAGPGGDPAVSSTAGSDPSGPAIASGTASPAGPESPLDAAAKRRRNEGIAALDAGQFERARAIFAELLDRHPGNIALQGLHGAAKVSLDRARSGAAANLSNVEPRKLATPPFAYTLRRAAPATGTGKAPKLRQRTARRNKITDDKQWFERNGLALPTWTVPNSARGEPGNLPGAVPLTYGRARLVQALRHPDHSILFYGANFSGGHLVVVIDRHGKVMASLDFTAYRRAPAGIPADRGFTDQLPVWAQVDGGVLYISHGHRTYAKSSAGRNAYITAIDLASGELLWRSDPLVSNSRNFLVRDGFIMTGYGFTAEPDFLFVLDQRNGKVRQKLRVKSGPDFILEKQGRLFVRTYDTDYEFSIE